MWPMHVAAAQGRQPCCCGAAPSAMRSVDAAVGFDRVTTVVFRGTSQKFFADGASDSRIERAKETPL